MLHLPSKDKIRDFNEAIKKKLEKPDFNFRGVWFPDERSFKGFHFKQKVDFSYAEFSVGADFDSTFDEDADFTYAIFNGEAYFRYATFKAALILRSATFNSHLRFGVEDEEKEDADAKRGFGEQASLDLQYARIERPDQVAFNNLTLRPYWFVNVDSRKFDFTHVDWDWRGINEEVESLKAKRVLSPHRMLSITYRHLAVNAEENHRYPEASEFRYRAMNAQRLEKSGVFGFLRLSWWYWLASGYGERTNRAALTLIGVWMLFALLYSWVGFARWEPKISSESEVQTVNRDVTGAPLRPFSRALGYSAGVMLLQKPEPRPVTIAAQSFVILETILGPLQAALLALAIRRKFMR
ncbi:MAG: pentapeptide repeat-containing protein [Pyrinomonadaceae bacterium]|nr:pentapeptide repeat-containing protein [Pyrinomonadaceae bacterium]